MYNLHSVVLGVVVSDGLQEGLGVITQGDSAAVEFGFVWCGGPWRAAVVLILLLIIIIVDLTRLKTTKENRRLEPF